MKLYWGGKAYSVSGGSGSAVDTYTKVQIDTKLADIEDEIDDVEEDVDKKASKATTLTGYGITDGLSTDDVKINYEWKDVTED